MRARARRGQFTNRPFAAGLPVFVDGYYTDRVYQEAAIATMRRQGVPFVLVPGPEYGANLEQSFPLLASYIAGRYQPLTTIGSSDTRVQILLDPRVPVMSRDVTTGWPCFR